MKDSADPGGRTAAKTSLDFAALTEAEATRQRRVRIRRLISQAVVAAAFVAIWEIAAGTVVDPFWVSSPSRVAEDLKDLAVSGDLWRHTAATLKAAWWGFVVGGLLGLITGLVLGRAERLRRIFQPFVMAGYVVPKVALAPLFILWFGLGIGSKIVLTATIVYFLVFLGVLEGARDVDAEQVALVRHYGASRSELLRTVILPSISPWILSAIRISVPFAFVGAVVGEFVAATAGLGYYMRQSAALFNTAGVFSGIVVLGVVGLIANALVERAEAFFMPWRDSSSEGGLPPASAAA